MKKLFFFMTLAAAMSTACRKEDEAQQSVEPSSKSVNITVGIDNPIKTRAVGIIGDNTDECKVNTLQVFIFNGDAIDGYGSINDATSINIGCTVGNRSIYAIVNASDLSSEVTSKTEFLAKVSSLGENVMNFEMIGNKTEEIKADTRSINLSVDRFVSRIKVKKVTNDLKSPALRAQGFVIKSMYLTNVAADIDYGMSDSYEVKTWYNKMAYQKDNNKGSMTYDQIDVTVDAGKSYGTEHCFYAYPNDAEPSTSSEWSPRSTMLVLKVQIGQNLYNYPIRLPALEGNRSYEIQEIKITRPGNLDDGLEGGSDELESVEGNDCDFTITVNPWTAIAVTEGTTI